MFDIALLLQTIADAIGYALTGFLEALWLFVGGG